MVEEEEYINVDTADGTNSTGTWINQMIDLVGYQGVMNAMDWVGRHFYTEQYRGYVQQQQDDVVREMQARNLRNSETRAMVTRGVRQQMTRQVKRAINYDERARTRKRHKHYYSMPGYRAENITNSTHTGGINTQWTLNLKTGPGACLTYPQIVRMQASQTFSVYHVYMAHCTPSTGTAGTSNTSRSAGEGQPLYFKLNNLFYNGITADCPTLPFTGGTNNLTTLTKMEGLCFNIQWPGENMHEDPLTQTLNSNTTSTYAYWYPIQDYSTNPVSNIDFSSVMLNQFWRKMVIGNVFLQYDFRNLSRYDYVIQIIWYTNKRKGINYANEFSQWINSSISNTNSNTITARDFYVDGRLPMTPPCKILRHKRFVLPSCLNSTGVQSYYPATGDAPANVLSAAVMRSNCKTVRMKSTSGFTLRRDTLNNADLVTNAKDWLNSTAVPEEQMIYCQVLACPMYQACILTNEGWNQPQPKNKGTPLQAYNFNAYQTKATDTTNNTVGTLIQQASEENYFLQDVNSAQQPIPGVECRIRRKLYFKVDKEIELTQTPVVPG